MIILRWRYDVSEFIGELLKMRITPIGRRKRINLAVVVVWFGGGDEGEVRWCGCDDGGSHGGVEDEARGGAWSGRSDRSGGRESFETRPENSSEKFSSGRR
ncbi:hypothetical protein Tco_0606243 [Tanacetum coccineum]